MEATYAINYKEHKIESGQKNHYCCKKCEVDYKSLYTAIKGNVQSHQLADAELYYKIAEKWKAAIPRLETLKQQIKELSDKFGKTNVPDKSDIKK